MERTIKVADTKTQKRYTIKTNATTLHELKEVLRNNGIDYTGMTFTEGLTKTSLVNDDAVLPANIPFGGRTTNDLVILLTNTTKNISSGMDRKEAYRLIKEKNLKSVVMDVYGRNFTQVPTAKLEQVINAKTDDKYSLAAETAKAETAKETPKATEAPEATLDTTEELPVCAQLSHVASAVSTCLNEVITSLSSLNEKLNAIAGPATKSDISDADVDKILEGLY